MSSSAFETHNSNTISIVIDGVLLGTSRLMVSSYTIMQHCDYLGMCLPRFCYHDQLTIAGNCRICLVELTSSIKPIISCGTEVVNRINIYTSSLLAISARESVLEFLLINHPLDCPICDQGGECDLQDLSFVFGSDVTRFIYSKRVAQDHSLGYFVKCIMTRCIHCTRCVRYMAEILGEPILGTLGRGSNFEIGTFIDVFYINTAVLGNIIDLCPVGALTSKPYSFSARPWELSSVESIDLLDSLCSNIRVDHRGLLIMRILPRLNVLINDEWISDKIRFCYDGLFINRITTPLFRNISNILHLCSWKTALISFRWHLIYYMSFSLKKISFFSGPFIDTFSLFLLKWFTNSLGVLKLNPTNNVNVDFRFNYQLLNSNSFSDGNVFFLITVNLKLESPILNIRLKQASNKYKTNMRIGYVGTHFNTNYKTIHIGLGSHIIFNVLFGRSFFCYDIYYINSSFKIINGINNSHSSFLTSGLNSVFSHILDTDSQINNHCLFSGDVLINELSARSSSFFFNRYTTFTTCSFLYLLGNTSILSINKNTFLNSLNFVIFQGHHIVHGIDDIHLFLPTSTFFEKSAVYMNCQGRLQRSAKSIPTLDYVYDDDIVLFCLVACTIATISFGVFYFSMLFTFYLPSFINIVSYNVICFLLCNSFFFLSNYFFLNMSVFVVSVRNTYVTDIISKCSKVLSILSDRFIQFFNHSNYI